MDSATSARRLLSHDGKSPTSDTSPTSLSSSPHDVAFDEIRPFTSLRKITPSSPLDSSHVSFWHDHGYLLLDGLFNKQLVSLVRDAVVNLIDKEDSRTALWEKGQVKFPFPFSEPELLVLNRVPMHTPLSLVVKDLLGTDYFEVMLSRADVSVQMTTCDQPFHLDIVNQQSLMIPDIATNLEGRRVPDALTALVYLDDGEICGGFTHIAKNDTEVNANAPNRNEESRENISEWESLWPPRGPYGTTWNVTSTGTESYCNNDSPRRLCTVRKPLFARENRLNFKKGTALFFRHDVWQRQTPVKNRKLLRSFKLVFKRKSCHWLPNLNLSVDMRVLDKIVAEANFFQRCLLGFPAPGSPYWTPETLRAVRERYQHIPGGFRYYELVNRCMLDNGKTLIVDVLDELKREPGADNKNGRVEKKKCRTNHKDGAHRTRDDISTRKQDISTGGRRYGDVQTASSADRSSLQLQAIADLTDSNQSRGTRHHRRIAQNGQATEPSPNPPVTGRNEGRNVYRRQRTDSGSRPQELIQSGGMQHGAIRNIGYSDSSTATSRRSNRRQQNAQSDMRVMTTQRRSFQREQGRRPMHNNRSVRTHSSDNNDDDKSLDSEELDTLMDVRLEEDFCDRYDDMHYFA